MTVRRKALVLDANILIRAVLGSRVRDLILANVEHVNFFVPSVCVEDARKYIPEILVERGIDPAPAIELLHEIVQHIETIEEEWLEDFTQVAKARMESRDPDDWPVLATALALDCPIWTGSRTAWVRLLMKTVEMVMTRSVRCMWRKYVARHRYVTSVSETTYPSAEHPLSCS